MSIDFPDIVVESFIVWLEDFGVLLHQSHELLLRELVLLFVQFELLEQKGGIFFNHQGNIWADFKIFLLKRLKIRYTSRSLRPAVSFFQRLFIGGKEHRSRSPLGSRCPLGITFIWWSLKSELGGFDLDKVSGHSTNHLLPLPTVALTGGLFLDFLHHFPGVVQDPRLAEVVMTLLGVHGVEEFLVVDDLLEFLFWVTVQLYYHRLYHFQQFFIRNSVCFVDVVELEQRVYSLFEVSLYEVLWIRN